MIKTSEVLRNAVTRAFEGGSTFANTSMFDFEQDVNDLENYLQDHFESWKREQAGSSAAEDTVTGVIEKHVQDANMRTYYISKILNALDEDLSAAVSY